MNTMNNIIKLPDRLKAISGYIDAGASVADIGTDHGFLPVYLAQSGLASRVIASDISAGSLKAAKRTADKYVVSEKIEFINAPGLDGIAPADVDTIVITGLGGETITGILNNAAWTRNKNIKLILQPQSKIDVLFKFLYNNGYMIRLTTSVREKGRSYTVVLAAGCDPCEAQRHAACNSSHRL